MKNKIFQIINNFKKHSSSVAKNVLFYLQKTFKIIKLKKRNLIYETCSTLIFFSLLALSKSTLSHQIRSVVLFVHIKCLLKANENVLIGMQFNEE